MIKELNAGEWTDMLVAMGERKPFYRIVAYVLGWSLIGLDRQPLPYSLEMSEDDRRATIRGLNKRIVREIYAVLDKHEAAEDAAVEAKKKTMAPALGSSPTSPSGEPQV